MYICVYFHLYVFHVAMASSMMAFVERPFLDAKLVFWRLLLPPANQRNINCKPSNYSWLES